MTRDGVANRSSIWVRPFNSVGRRVYCLTRFPGANRFQLRSKKRLDGRVARSSRKVTGLRSSGQRRTEVESMVEKSRVQGSATVRLHIITVRSIVMTASDFTIRKHAPDAVRRGRLPCFLVTVKRPDRTVIASAEACHHKGSDYGPRPLAPARKSARCLSDNDGLPGKPGSGAQTLAAGGARRAARTWRRRSCETGTEAVTAAHSWLGDKSASRSSPRPGNDADKMR